MNYKSCSKTIIAPENCFEYFEETNVLSFKQTFGE